MNLHSPATRTPARPGVRGLAYVCGPSMKVLGIPANV